MIECVDATPMNTFAVVADMREVDKLELQLFLGKNPYDATQFILKNANKAKVVVINKVPAAIFGYNVTNAMFEVASPFMIATNYGASQTHLAAKGSRIMLKEFQGYFLQNYVLDRNEVAKKWLVWLGFDLHGVTEFNGYKIRMFTKDCR